MENYEIIAFYKSDKNEVQIHAEILKEKLGLNLRYEQLPANRKIVKSMVTEYTVFCIFNRDVMSFMRVLKYAYEPLCPALLVSASDSLDSYENLKLPIGYLAENKEKVLWANFFIKRSTALNLELIIPTEKDENIINMIDSNVNFIENVLNSSRTQYSKRYSNKGFEEMLKEEMQATDKGVLLMMRPFRIFPFYIPLNLRLYKRYGKTQVIFIPRDDEMYVPCH